MNPWVPLEVEDGQQLYAFCLGLDYLKDTVFSGLDACAECAGMPLSFFHGTAIWWIWTLI